MTVPCRPTLKLRWNVRWAATCTSSIEMWTHTVLQWSPRYHIVVIIKIANPKKDSVQPRSKWKQSRWSPCITGTSLSVGTSRAYTRGPFEYRVKSDIFGRVSGHVRTPPKTGSCGSRGTYLYAAHEIMCYTYTVQRVPVYSVFTLDRKRPPERAQSLFAR